MKALVGSWDNRPYRLLAEITALRTRVAELEQELALVREENALLREENALLRESVHDEDLEVALSTSR